MDQFSWRLDFRPWSLVAWSQKWLANLHVIVGLTSTSHQQYADCCLIFVGFSWRNALLKEMTLLPSHAAEVLGVTWSSSATWKCQPNIGVKTRWIYIYSGLVPQTWTPNSTVSLQKLKEILKFSSAQWIAQHLSERFKNLRKKQGTSALDQATSAPQRVQITDEPSLHSNCISKAPMCDRVLWRWFFIFFITCHGYC